MVRSGLVICSLPFVADLRSSHVAEWPNALSSARTHILDHPHRTNSKASEQTRSYERRDSYSPPQLTPTNTHGNPPHRFPSPLAQLSYSALSTQTKDNTRYNPQRTLGADRSPTRAAFAHRTPHFPHPSPHREPPHLRRSGPFQ